MSNDLPQRKLKGSLEHLKQSTATYVVNISILLPCVYRMLLQGRRHVRARLSCAFNRTDCRPTEITGSSWPTKTKKNLQENRTVAVKFKKSKAGHGSLVQAPWMSHLILIVRTAFLKTGSKYDNSKIWPPNQMHNTMTTVNLLSSSVAFQQHGAIRRAHLVTKIYKQQHKLQNTKLLFVSLGLWVVYLIWGVAAKPVLKM